MGVIHAVFPQEWRVLGLLLLDAVLDCEGLSGEAGDWGVLVVLTTARRIFFLPLRRGVGGSGGRNPDGSGSGGAPAVAGAAVSVAGGGGGGRGVGGG